MSKVIAYCPLHYGSEYLDVAIRAVEPFVDKILMMYTERPSYGFETQMRNPDSEEQLKSIAFRASNKVGWIKIRAGNEGHHRGMIYDHAHGYDLILTFDSDEVFEPEDLQGSIQQALTMNKRYIGISGYVNFWKSFNWACYDGFMPIRMINPKAAGGSVGGVNQRVYHFSTAQGMEMMRYKLAIHGHKAEIRQNWLEEIYERWTPENNFGDLHLVSLGLWNATRFDKTKLPAILKEHQNYSKEEIR